MEKPAVTRMLKSKRAKSPEGNTVLVRMFQSGKTYSVVQGTNKMLETLSQTEASAAFTKACNEGPRGTPATKGLPRKRKTEAPIIYRGGLPSLGKRHS